VDSALGGGLGLPYNPGALLQCLSSSQSHIPYGQVQRAQHLIRVNAALPRVCELGFRVALHDVSAACMSMLSLVMEPGEGEDEDEGSEEGEGECEGEGEWQEQHQEGREEGYEREGEYVDEHGGGYDGQSEYLGGGDADATDAEEGTEPMRRKQQKARKLRRPYTVTCALRKTNWFESSMEWENEHFRVVYRLVKYYEHDNELPLTGGVL
ncbi:hypothetical protein FRC10_002125, partial [Ceratobasidium sp. 414]